MAKKVFTDESLATFVDEIKTYTDSAVSTKANSSHTHDDRYYTESEIDSKVATLNTDISTKANSSHTHTIANVTSLQSTLDAKVPTSRTVNGKALSANITLSASDVGTYTKAEIDALELITIDDIDTICGGSIVAASEVQY